VAKRGRWLGGVQICFGTFVLSSRSQSVRGEASLGLGNVAKGEGEAYGVGFESATGDDPHRHHPVGVAAVPILLAWPMS